MDVPAPVTILINRKAFILTLLMYKVNSEGYVKVRRETFPVAVGMVGFPTKAGEYRVLGKTRTPDWAPPKWSGRDEDIIPYESPDNPFDGAFISFEDDIPKNDNEGQGIHGTKFDPQVGTRASHGCVRMLTKDVKYIYEKVPIGTLVLVY
jgi:L,D-transpeptidase ErfK/SrfK